MADEEVQFSPLDVWLRSAIVSMAVEADSALGVIVMKKVVAAVDAGLSLPSVLGTFVAFIQVLGMELQSEQQTSGPPAVPPDRELHEVINVVGMKWLNAMRPGLDEESVTKLDAAIAAWEAAHE